MNPLPFVVRSDRDAMRLVGIKSPTTFAAWAVKKGLKPAVKHTRQERTVYSVEALRRAALEDVQRISAWPHNQKHGKPQ